MSLDIRTPVVGVARNPLLGLRPGDMGTCAVGTRIRDLEPQSSGGLIVCKYNGEWLLREHWDEWLKPGDVLEFHEYPQSRGVLQVALLVVALVVAFYTQDYALAFKIYTIGSIAINLLVPVRGAQVPNLGQAAGGVFSTSLNGNQGRLDQPIWKNCGRVKITPPFAAQPYSVYQPSDVANPTVDMDQYYYAVFAVGFGQQDIEKTFIAKTSITHFQDVIVANYLPPGTLPSIALCNVVTSTDVSSNELKKLEYSGGFVVCRPGDKVVAIGIDVAAGQGLGSGASDPVTVSWTVEIRRINDFGSALSGWSIIGSGSRTAATNTPQRWSDKYTLSTPMRCEVRMRRTNDKSTDPSVRDGLQWIGLRGYLQRPAPLDSRVGHYEVVMRASEQLSQVTQRDFSMIVRAYARPYVPGVGWSPYQFTRNPAWWMLELLSNSGWGLSIPDRLIDFKAFADLAVKCDLRQDHFDYTFDTARDGWEALQLIAHACRCRVFRRAGGVYTVARDEWIDLPSGALMPGNTSPKSMAMDVQTPPVEFADGIVIEYLSNVSWDKATIECPMDGYSAVDTSAPRYNPALPAMSRPLYVQADGITGSFQALREGIYQAASLQYRPGTVAAQVEWEGALPAFFDQLRWMPKFSDYGQSGDVTAWDPATMVLGLTEQPDWTRAPLYLVLRRDDGTLTTPVQVFPGPNPTDVTLQTAPDFTIVVTDGTRERPMFMIGPLQGSDEFVKLAQVSDGGRTPNGTPLFNLTAVIDDKRVHLADNPYLPGPGVIQDPIDDTGTDDGSSPVIVPALMDHYYPPVGSYDGLDHLHEKYTYAMTLDGKSTVRRYAPDGTLLQTFVLTGEYMTNPPEPTTLSMYEVNFSVQAVQDPAILSGSAAAFNTWLPLSTAHTWTIDGSLSSTEFLTLTQINIMIRIAGDTVIQAQGLFSVQLNGANTDTGGSGA